MKFQVFDKAKWHWGAANAPQDIPQEFGGTHIAFFLRWCIEHDFMSKEMVEECADEFQQIKCKMLDCREFFMHTMDGVFSTEELNTKGNKFACAYYGGDKTKFAKAYGYYLSDYDKLIADVFKENNHGNAYFYFENSEENYSIVKQIIDKRYSEFCELSTAK